MDEFKRGLAERIHSIELLSLKTDECEQEFGRKLHSYMTKARDILKKKNAINPKPQKKLMRAISEDESEEGEPEKNEFLVPTVPPKTKPPLTENASSNSTDRDSLRPVRSAKLNARSNLKEVPQNIKMRNDNNVAVVVKTERISTADPVNNSNKGSRDSLKENSQPASSKRGGSVDEGVQMSGESDVQSERDNGRSMSVEFIAQKAVEIDITQDEAADSMMPPPPLPVKKKTRQKQAPKQSDLPQDPTQPIPMRVTRSKIKTEKPSIGKVASASVLEQTKDVTDNNCIRETVSETTTAAALEETTVTNKKGKGKKYPKPIVVKVERISSETSEKTQPPALQPLPEATSAHQKKSSKQVANVESPPVLPSTPPFTSVNDFPMNETVTISTNALANETITLATHNNVNETVTLEKNHHDSLMTEDNDDDDSMTANVPLASLVPPKGAEMKQSSSKQQPLPIKLKKNEVFNPYLSSPVKQKVQAFEKHSTLNTPDPSKAASATKYHTLKAGTPSKIGVYSSKTTPLSNAKQRYMSAVASSASSSSSSTTLSSTKSASAKKYTSLSHDSDEKKKQREEKQQKVQLQREAIEKQKREQTLQQQREREEKFRKLMLEKEEQKKLEALKKKQMKENQEKKYAEEKLKKEEFAVPKEPPSASKDNSLYIKMQKQIMMDKSAQQQQKKKPQTDANAYCFDMLNTDDSTDDESKPSKKRPDPPQWSRKQYRSRQIQIQSFTNPQLLDILFSSQAITVDLKQIFPSIEPRKLIRNSSAVWNTPPRYSQIPKY